jgi:hypothetical protein
MSPAPKEENVDWKGEINILYHVLVNLENCKKVSAEVIEQYMLGEI